MSLYSDGGYWFAKNQDQGLDLEMEIKLEAEVLDQNLEQNQNQEIKCKK